jgi:alginate O-acetyltransferase complex protein AlgI
MVFSNPFFLFFFLPIVLLLYFVSPTKVKNLVLFLSSLFFYTWGEKALVLVMLFSTLVDYSSGIIIEKGMRRTGLVMSIVANLCLLGFFKYFNFAFAGYHAMLQFFHVEWEGFYNLPKIALPIGISFYTFQTMSYTIDVYRGHVKANRNFIDFGAYVTMFPQLVAGPIVRYVDIEKQLSNRKITLDGFSMGVERFIVGLAKKMILANTFAGIADGVFAHDYSQLSFGYAWLGIVAYSLQIYFDFSGYSDMAIGLGKMFGFDFLDNFNYPYFSKSIREFWRRWHISLSNWFRDYLYISLGGNRKGKLRMYMALLLVFFVTGLWHGASWSFVVWGLFHGAFILLERTPVGKVIERLPAILRHAYLLIVVMAGWVLFRTNSIADAWLYWKAMAGLSHPDAAVMSYLDFFINNFKTYFFIAIGIILSAPVYSWVESKTRGLFYGVLRPVFFVALFAISLIYVGSGSYNPFIYFRF